MSLRTLLVPTSPSANRKFSTLDFAGLYSSHSALSPKRSQLPGRCKGFGLFGVLLPDCTFSFIAPLSKELFCCMLGRNDHFFFELPEPDGVLRPDPVPTGGPKFAS